MASPRNYLAKHAVRQARRRFALVSARRSQRAVNRARRSNLGHRSDCEPFAPPEDWYEPTGNGQYRLIVQAPGEGYRHIVTANQVRDRLGNIPRHFLRELEVVQLSCMTRKKQTFPCYGMQWGSALYLYPLEDTLMEHFYRPPRPTLVNEVKMYGGRWAHPNPGLWTLIWSEQAAQDFYLNNILIHELGHLIDERNSGYADRERFAEWFAVEYGYRKSGGSESRRPRRKVRRRHHAC